MSADRKRYDTTNLPYNEDLSRYAPDYIPEIFTTEEQKYLKPFFSNIDKPVFVTYNLPEEVNAALDSRYSRSTKSKRRLFIDEYVNTIKFPEKAKDWDEKTNEEKKLAFETRDKFERFIEFTNREGGITEIVNTQRARGFFEKWLSEFGDDSIAELGGGIHVSCEGISSVLVEEVISKRVGISPLVKSTRFVQFSEKLPNGEYRYQVPGEIRGDELETEYKAGIDELFHLYSFLESAYLEYTMEKFPKDEDETDGSFARSRGAKRYDDIRDLLPFSTLNNIALSGNGRSYEDLVNRLLGNSLGEARWLGQTICKELESVVPSFVKRPQTERGAEIQLYRSNIDNLRQEMGLENLPGALKERVGSEWAEMVSSTDEADVEILAAYLVPSNEHKTLQEWKSEISQKSGAERGKLLKRILDERKLGRNEAERYRDRFKKVPRAFERAVYAYDLWARGGDMRDLRRHRMLTEGHAPVTVVWGFDLEREVVESPFKEEIEEILMKSAMLYLKISSKFGPEVAQYAVPFAFIQHWFVSLSAREIYWMGELRTGPQARSHYKQVVLDMVDQAVAKDPNVFQGIMVDRNDYRLARRESEKKKDKK